VLCEKPVADDFRDTKRAAALAREKGLKTKLGFTFRYSPAVQYAKALIDEGFIGTPYMFNGYEQNSQWLNPAEPLRQEDHEADQSVMQVSSMQSYGAPIMDIAHLCMGSRFGRVIGVMKNFIPERAVRAT
jgi:predicted dehydrogenase